MKEKIIESSLQQFLTYGIRKITMQKLVEALGVSTKTVYKYFRNKEELLEECLNIHYGELNRQIVNILDESPDIVTSICRIYSKAVELDFGTNHLFYHDLNNYYPQLQDKVIQQSTGESALTLTALIEQGVNEGYFLPHLQPAIVLETLSVLYTSVTRYNVYKKFNLKRELINHTIAIYLRGICTAKGLEIMNSLKEFSN